MYNTQPAAVRAILISSSAGRDSSATRLFRYTRFETDVRAVRLVTLGGRQKKKTPAQHKDRQTEHVHDYGGPIEADEAGKAKQRAMTRQGQAGRTRAFAAFGSRSAGA